MGWSDYVVEKRPTGREREEQAHQVKKDRDFLHGILIGGMLAVFVFGIIFGVLYGNLLAACGVG